MAVGIAADHGGFELKMQLTVLLHEAGYIITDFGAHELFTEDDYPDYILPMAKAVAKAEIQRGIAICGSGVGACVAANKVYGIRAALITDSFSAHQGVEDDNMNVICLGGRVTGSSLAWELVQIFLKAEFKGEERFKRRLDKIMVFEMKKPKV
ncbi:MAG: RpiB/LacA/LacB family sugar-phosphate isomerase [Ferruginibacter sp.]|nr:RpiB/LacA/LacB family sugar-phosphate isomerase [Ferruginibacter sp.]